MNKDEPRVYKLCGYCKHDLVKHPYDRLNDQGLGCKNCKRYWEATQEKKSQNHTGKR